MTITRDSCYCDNPECRATTLLGSDRLGRWETLAVDEMEGIAEAHLCERCSGRRAAGRSLDFQNRSVQVSV